MLSAAGLVSSTAVSVWQLHSYKHSHSIYCINTVAFLVPLLRSCPCPTDICSTVLNDCAADANCTHFAQDEFNCTCMEGFEGNGFTCSDIDECKDLNNSVLCPANAACVNKEGGYVCQCAGNRVNNGSECVCKENLTEDLELKECVCPSSSVYSTTQEQCVCRNNSIWNGSACECLPGFVEANVTGLCECLPNFLLYFDSELNRPTCVCAFDGLKYDEQLGDCTCGGNRTFNGSECVCREGFVVNVSDEPDNCVCPPGMEYSSSVDSCICLAKFMEYDALTKRCVCKGNRTDVGGQCECRGNFINSESGKECVCPANMVYSGTAEMCVCPDGMEYDVSIESCACMSPYTSTESNVCECPEEREGCPSVFTKLLQEVCALVWMGAHIHVKSNFLCHGHVEDFFNSVLSSQ